MIYIIINTTIKTNKTINTRKNNKNISKISILLLEEHHVVLLLSCVFFILLEPEKLLLIESEKLLLILLLILVLLLLLILNDTQIRFDSLSNSTRVFLSVLIILISCLL